MAEREEPEELLHVRVPARGRVEQPTVEELERGLVHRVGGEVDLTAGLLREREREEKGVT